MMLRAFKYLALIGSHRNIVTVTCGRLMRVRPRPLTVTTRILNSNIASDHKNKYNSDLDPTRVKGVNDNSRGLNELVVTVPGTGFKTRFAKIIESLIKGYQVKILAGFICTVVVGYSALSLTDFSVTVFGFEIGVGSPLTTYQICSLLGLGILVVTTVQYGPIIKNLLKGNQILKAAQKGRDDDLRRILEELKGQSNNFVNERHMWGYGWTPLHVAAMNGKASTVEILLSAGADPNIGDEFSTPYLMGRKLRMDSLKVRAKREDQFSDRLDIQRNYRGCTPLHYACLADDRDTVNVLLEKGALSTVPNDSYQYPMDYAKTAAIKNILNSGITMIERIRREKEMVERRRIPLEQAFKQIIVGQVGAITTVARTIRRKEDELNGDTGPLVFLFLGPSRVGKTQLAKQIATLHKGEKEAFVRIDMSEYGDSNSLRREVGRFIGLPGHKRIQAKQLKNELRKVLPNAVVLFDKIGYAGSDARQVLLEIFEEGTMTDEKGKKIECKNAIFVMTFDSDLAGDNIAKQTLQLRKEGSKMDDREISDRITKSSKFQEDAVRQILEHNFPKEFLGTIDEFVHFLPFSKSELFKLVEKELQFSAVKARNEHNIELTWDRVVLEALTEGYNKKYGVRSIKHEVERRIVNQLTFAHERSFLKEPIIIHIAAEELPYTVTGDKYSIRLIVRRAGDNDVDSTNPLTSQLNSM